MLYACCGALRIGSGRGRGGPLRIGYAPIAPCWPISPSRRCHSSEPIALFCCGSPGSRRAPPAHGPPRVWPCWRRWRPRSSPRSASPPRGGRLASPSPLSALRAGPAGCRTRPRASCWRQCRPGRPHPLRPASSRPIAARPGGGAICCASGLLEEVRTRRFTSRRGSLHLSAGAASAGGGLALEPGRSSPAFRSHHPRPSWGGPSPSKRAGTSTTKRRT